MLDEKYMVFKMSEWKAVGAAAIPLDDAVVIRTQDAFATGGLWAYAHSIRTHIELYDLFDEQKEKCERAERYFVERATEAQAILEAGKAKIPD